MIPPLCGPDHYVHIPPYRQRRHQRRGHRNRQSRGDAGCARRHTSQRQHDAFELSRPPAARSLVEVARHYRPCWRRYPCFDCPDPQPRHAQRHYRAARADGVFDLDTLKAKARAWPGLVGMDLVPMVTSGPALHLGRNALAMECRVWSPGIPAFRSRRDRLRDKAQYPSVCSPAQVRGVTVVPVDHIGRRYPSSEPRRGVPVQRSRRSRGDRRICGSCDPQARLIPVGRSSVSASAIRCWALRLAARDDENAPGPSRRQSSRQTFSLTGKVEITSMNHGFAVYRASLPGKRRGNPCIAVRRLELWTCPHGSPGVLGAVPPGSIARPARQPLFVRSLHRPDARPPCRLTQRQVATAGPVEMPAPSGRSKWQLACLKDCGRRTAPVGTAPSAHGSTLRRADC